MIDILIVFLLILVNGFFALSEIALVSSKKTRLGTDSKSGDKGAKAAIELLNNSERFLSAIQVGITLIGIINGVYGGTNIADKVTPFFAQFPLTTTYAPQVALVLTVFIITYLSIVVGELVPKTIALNNPERIAKHVSVPILYFSKIFYPFVKLLSSSTNLITKMLGIRHKEHTVSEMELRTMMKIAASEGVIEKEQDIIHEKVFYFSDKRAKHLMTHRTDVEWVDIMQPHEGVIEDLLRLKHSKILACNEALDDFIGIISMKEFLLQLNKNKNFSFRTLITEPLIIPENIRAQEVLNLFKHNHKFLAVVVDEYGSFNGVITLHDIIENLIGAMPNECEIEEPDIVIREDNSALVNGEAPIEILSHFIDGYVVDFENIDYSTIAGFLLAHINKIPQSGDKFLYENIAFEIMDIDGTKIDKVLLTKLKKDDKSEKII